MPLLRSSKKLDSLIKNVRTGDSPKKRESPGKFMLVVILNSYKGYSLGHSGTSWAMQCWCDLNCSVAVKEPGGEQMRQNGGII